MKPWNRNDTKRWISALEDRIDEISHYLELTADWCEQQGVYDDRIIFMCCLLTCIRVSQLRNEPISYIEIMELLGIDEKELEIQEKYYELSPEFLEINHYEFLEKVVSMIDQNDLEF